LAVGATFAVAQFVASNFISVELTDIIASLLGLVAAVIILRVWTPQGGAEAAERLRAHQAEEAAGTGTRDRGETALGGGTGGGTTRTVEQAPVSESTRLSGGRLFLAFFPYLLVIVVFCLAKLVAPLTKALSATDWKIKWPGLDGHVLSAAGKPVTSTVYNFQWLSSPGTLLLICGIITALVYRLSPAKAAGEFAATAVKLRFAFLTVASVLALAYVMNLSGQTTTIGTWIAGTGAAFAFLSPILGWLGTAVTGSDTSSNSLFGVLQVSAAKEAGLDPTLLASANSSGGVLGKMISPQNLAIGAAAVGLSAQEGDLFRKVIGWSLFLLLIMCILVYLQSTAVLSWMVV